MRLAYRLADLPVEMLGRLRSDRVLHFPEPQRRPGTTGRPRRHGREFALADPATWPAAAGDHHDGDHPVRAPPQRKPGTGCTRGSPTAPPGWITTARCPSSREP